MTISAPQKPTAMASQCPRLTRSASMGPASAATRSGEGNDTAVASASGTKPSAAKKKLVEASSRNDRATCVPGLRVASRRHQPWDGPKIRKMNSVCPSVRAQISSTVGRCGRRSFTPVFMMTKKTVARTMKKMPRRMRGSAWVTPRGFTRSARRRARREPDAPPDLRRARQRVVGGLDAREAGEDPGRHGCPAPGLLAHVQGQELVGGGEVALSRVIHLVEVVEAVGVVGQEPGREAEGIPRPDLAVVGDEIGRAHV